MTTIHPRARFSKATRLLLLALCAVFVVSIFLAAMRGQLTATAAFDFLLGAGVVGAVLALLFAESRRAYSVELTEELVTSLVWQRAFGVLPYKLVPRTICWAQLREITRRGFIVGLKGPSGEILINTYLFEDPDKVLAFINERAGGVRRA